MSEVEIIPSLDTALEWRSAGGLTIAEAMEAAIRKLELQKLWADACNAAEVMGGNPNDFMPASQPARLLSCHTHQPIQYQLHPDS